MRAIPFIILALLGPLPVIAQELVPQDITVRAGRHPSFTRLTFPLPADATWQLGRDGASSYLLRINGVAVSFDTQQVYQRIGTERIAALAPDGSDFGLTLGCACYADAFIAAPNLLAVDIRDGVPRRPPGSRLRLTLFCRCRISRDRCLWFFCRRQPQRRLSILARSSGLYRNLSRALQHRVWLMQRFP
ncbi:hypothetical protein [Ketogulonicigenium vulgare]|uniref:hypothetical protein n=1 Tax=Ketogulonicigenium vulgare TaxID=92945 RepID=UPI000810489B|nr:hypothetical protein [Ketogulonicigenium vulgare]ANW34539.1 hypothetical protein KvSKV_12300 [Ketogulonicigenium vulgare]